HTPGHSVVRLSSGGERLMFAGDAVFPVSFDHPEWHNGFEHDPEEATRVRVGLMRELASTGAWLVATHMPFPSVGRVAVAGDLFRWVPAWWDYRPLVGNRRAMIVCSCNVLSDQDVRSAVAAERTRSTSRVYG